MKGNDERNAIVDDKEKEQNYLQLISSTRKTETTKSFLDPEGLPRFGIPSIIGFFLSLYEMDGLLL